jgi:arsenate reductase-like glutaredoxin family protein
MKTYKYTESDLENATLEWLEELGYSVAFGQFFAKGMRRKLLSRRLN